VDGFHHNTATFVEGNNLFLDLHGAWARSTYAGPHYFSIQYRTPTGFSLLTVKKNSRTKTCMP